MPPPPAPGSRPRYGRDTRGLIRQHQFQKVELVKVVAPQDAEAEHETLTVCHPRRKDWVLREGTPQLTPRPRDPIVFHE